MRCTKFDFLIREIFSYFQLHDFKRVYGSSVQRLFVIIDGAINNMIQITRYYCFHHQYLILELWIRLKHFTTEYYCY